MKKLMLCFFLSILFINAYSQDTICTMVMQDVVHKFDYYTNTILESNEHTEGSVFINVSDGEVLCLHLFDEKKRYRKVIRYYNDGDVVKDILNSKSNVYYTTGPVRVEVRRSTILKI